MNTFALPYVFDTQSVVRMVPRVVAGFWAVAVVPGIVYSLLVRRSGVAVLQVTLIGALTLLFAYVVCKNMKGAAGIIRQDAVEVKPITVFGRLSAQPASRFAISRFSTVRIERIDRRIDTTPSTARHERVWLIGKAGTPDILVARTRNEEGVVLGKGLGAALGLPSETVDRPY